MLQRAGDGNPCGLVPVDAADHEHAGGVRVAGAHGDDRSPILRVAE
jgi:hypothetical protein